jgi:uncharacterized membrane protein YphA (DoxX/SURF4 family)
MFDGATRQSLAAFLLRIVLGVIFIYHGVFKITPENDWGGSWATNYWNNQGKAPMDVLEKLHSLKDFDEKQVTNITAQLARMYTDVHGAAPPLPDSLSHSAAQLAVAWGEVIGGAALILGLLTRLAAFGEIIIQIGAIATVTMYRGFSFAGGGGAEFNIALLAMCLDLLITGGGLWALDALIVHSRKRAAATATASSQQQVAGPVAS